MKWRHESKGYMVLGFGVHCLFHLATCLSVYSPKFISYQFIALIMKYAFIVNLSICQSVKMSTLIRQFLWQHLYSPTIYKRQYVNLSISSTLIVKFLLQHLELVIIDMFYLSIPFFVNMSICDLSVHIY